MESTRACSVKSKYIPCSCQSTYKTPYHTVWLLKYPYQLVCVHEISLKYQKTKFKSAYRHFIFSFVWKVDIICMQHAISFFGLTWKDDLLQHVSAPTRHNVLVCQIYSLVSTGYSHPLTQSLPKQLQTAALTFASLFLFGKLPLTNPVYFIYSWPAAMQVAQPLKTSMVPSKK